MRERPHQAEAIKIMRARLNLTPELDAKLTDEKVAGMYGTAWIEQGLAQDDLARAIVGSGAGRRVRAALLKFSVALSR